MDDRIMSKKTILFLHGFASSGQSTKARYFRDKCEGLPQIDYHAINLNPTPRDFEYMTTTGLVNRLRQYSLDHDLKTVGIIGSSYGGLVAIHYAYRFGGVEWMLLLAPGLRWLSGGLSEEQLDAWKTAGAAPVYHEAFQKEVPVQHDLQVDGMSYLEPVPPAVSTKIIHGKSDTTVPIEDSRAYAAQYPNKVQLSEVEADHDLNNHLDYVWEYVQSFLLDT
jgi:pimeloyl-ACP methyl ester carboxylesterase